MRALENANISLALYAAIIMWCFLATEMEVFMVRANDAEANTSHDKSHVVDTMAANFEAPATSGETKPWPADGETVSANPPCFVYPAMENFEIDEEVLHSIPMRRQGSLAEIARTAAFLLSEDSGYITGQNIRVDGGITRSV